MAAMPGWLHHIDITVSDMAASTRFYERVMPIMDFRRIPDTPTGEPLWAGDRMELCLMRAQPASLRPHDRYAPGLHHLAFGAPTRADVDRVHRELVALGVHILDPPAQYDEYGPGYYAVFFADPDGIKLEYVYTP
jgi:catechol 2,3-dioxygenase-like lactoylglutathione lyase family enzyme